jgi:hypothetical protein
MTTRDDDRRETGTTSDALDQVIDRAFDRWRRESRTNVRASVMTSLADGAPRRVFAVHWQFACGCAAIGLLVLAVVAVLWQPVSRPLPPVPGPDDPQARGGSQATILNLPGLRGVSAVPDSPPSVMQTSQKPEIPEKKVMPSRRFAMMHADGDALDPADRLPDPAPVVVEPITIAPIENMLIQEAPITVRPIAIPPFDLPSKGNDERVPEGARK